MGIMYLLYGTHLKLLLVVLSNHSVSGENRIFEVWGIFLDVIIYNRWRTLSELFILFFTN